MSRSRMTTHAGGSIRSLVLLMAALTVAGAIAHGGSGREKSKGHLCIIGGGNRDARMMKEFIRLAGGEKSVILVVPMASGTPDTTGMEQSAEIKALGAGSVSPLLITREEAMQPATLARLNGVTGVFFSGGDQARLTAVVGGTPVHERFLAMYREGAVMGGTSAGAAIMSRVMITGDERLNRDSTNGFVFARRNNVVTIDGLGFLGTVIIDQHFLRRKRHNRLISVVLEHQKLIGVGIDESTAIIVEPDSTFRVMGEGGVLVLDATGASKTKEDPRGNLGAAGMKMHMLLDGDRFDMRRLKVIPGVGR